MTDAPTGFHTRGDQPIIASKSALLDGKELAFVALERTRMPMVISDPRLPDNPIVLVNAAFLQQTGYAAGEVIGRNCRFLQGNETDPRAVEIIRDAIQAEEPVTVELINYRKDGRPFWNQLHISPVHTDGGELSYFFASQMDVTATRKAQDLEHAEHGLLLEVDHRAKNALALVQGIVRLSDRRHGAEAYADAVLARVDAVAIAHGLLSDARWRSVELGRLVSALSNSAIEGRTPGPPVLLSADQVQPLAIVLNELLAEPDARPAAVSQGRSVGWALDDGTLAIEIAQPSHGAKLISTADFGARMVEQVVNRQLRGSLIRERRAGNEVTKLLLPMRAS